MRQQYVANTTTLFPSMKPLNKPMAMALAAGKHDDAISVLRHEKKENPKEK
jgi:hypothetical protein